MDKGKVGEEITNEKVLGRVAENRTLVNNITVQKIQLDLKYSKNIIMTLKDR